MKAKLKEPLTQKPVVTHHYLHELAKEFRNEIKPWFPAYPMISFAHFFVLPEYYRDLRDHIKSGGAIQRTNGGWRKV